MKVLFIGGTGKISSACTPLAVERGYEMYLLNRGQTDRPVPEGVTQIVGDIRDKESAKAALAGHEFDAVVDWIAFTPEHVEADLELFRGRTNQYIFISSASAYQSPPVNQPVTESTPLDNPYWLYSQNKIACEELLMRAYREEKFPMTVVRPSHTYDRTMLPFQGGWTVVDRMRNGQKILVHGDGTSLWVIGEAFQITSDELLTWNEIHEIFARAADAPPPEIVHVPSDLINAVDPNWGAGLLGDKANSMVFDNSKIKRVVPDFACTTSFERGAEEVVAWYDEDPSRRVVDADFNGLTDQIITRYERAWEGL